MEVLIPDTRHFVYVPDSLDNLRTYGARADLPTGYTTVYIGTLLLNYGQWL